MLVGKELDNSAASRASIFLKKSACVGGAAVGYISRWLGRLCAMILACFLCCCFITAWILPTTESGLEAEGCFMLQFFVQGASVVVPIYLSKISPMTFRAILSPPEQRHLVAIDSLINHLSENNYLVIHPGERVHAYGPITGISTAMIAVGLALTAAVGHEGKGALFECAAAAGRIGAGERAAIIRIEDHFVAAESTEDRPTILHADDEKKGGATKVITSTA